MLLQGRWNSVRAFWDRLNLSIVQGMLACVQTDIRCLEPVSSRNDSCGPEKKDRDAEYRSAEDTRCGGHSRRIQNRAARGVIRTRAMILFCPECKELAVFPRTIIFTSNRNACIFLSMLHLYPPPVSESSGVGTKKYDWLTVDSKES